MYWLGGTIYNMKKERKQSCEFVAFDGEKFLIEWYFDTKGHSVALDYFESLSGILAQSKMRLNSGVKGIKFLPSSLSHTDSYVFSSLDKKLL